MSQGYVVWGFFTPGGSPKANWTWVRQRAIPATLQQRPDGLFGHKSGAKPEEGDQGRACSGGQPKEKTRAHLPEGASTRSHWGRLLSRPLL